MKKIYVVGGTLYYANWLEEIGFELTNEFDKCDLLMFTGGEDVSPGLYGHNRLEGTGNNPFRDEKEVAFFNRGLKAGLNMIGICRGSQFLGVMSGAKLVQDMIHGFTHKVKTFDGKTFVANSTHHQAVYIPSNLVEGEDYSLLAWAENLSPFHSIADESIKFLKNYKETECTYWHKTKCFGVQSHPESTIGSDWNKWLQEQVTRIFDF